MLGETPALIPEKGPHYPEAITKLIILSKYTWAETQQCKNKWIEPNQRDWVKIPIQPGLSKAPLKQNKIIAGMLEKKKELMK